ncbi:uncharacterized protein BJ171DRAFT_533921 [Polychytrium aggregatum]|uniref:uncharacterized protein n=1 Tax=Polychytrium aggregatum TaxID=110093 RepID=UPI0022FED6EC|nr:uncharacterized protein BJ171DRAFT_533921 [Polychytrium aggregatum]KAI9193073.1 hypothetical protein BJ171DRAFT_533921 [Polychytrium aggregatum]
MLSAVRKKPGICPSPNEVQHQLQEDRKQRRLSRLKETREKERGLAEKQRVAYRDMQQRRLQAATQFKQAEEQRKTHQAIEDEQRMQQQLGHIVGQAHRSAIEENRRKTKQEQENQVLARRRLEVQQERSQHALQLELEQRAHRTKCEQTRRELHLAIHEQERARARFIAAKQKLVDCSSFPACELASQSLVRVRHEFYHPGGARKYSHTEFHRDYHAVRCDYSSSKATPQAGDNVELVAQERANEILCQEERLEKLRDIAQKRFQKAMEADAMNQKREQLCQELDALAFADRRRRQWTGVRHFTPFRKNNAGARHPVLNERFNQKFAAEPQATKTNYRPSFESRARGSVKGVNDDSIEFVVDPVHNYIGAKEDSVYP